MSVRQQIDDFLALKRIAIVGISRTDGDFTRMVFREFVKRGYEVVPVNPAAEEIEGRPCFARVQDIQPPVDGVLVMTAPSVTEQIVRDCAEAGVRRVWMHRGEGIGAVSDRALELCQEYGIGVVPGFCPYMFLSETGFVHRIHGFFKKMGGTYPN
ncbi:MAG: CoA-binding protein [Chloroflexi bacterium]|nr:CoA-binding protein [Chloroflexota bacterium]MDL1885113.1 CoA-binding protein [Anaerolineae bacterium CFX8]GIL14548.1 MAG: CoA-binding protein [Chloroflexota bacterium]